MSIPIVVDDREQRSGVVEPLLRTQQFDVSVQRLSLGDYRVDGRFLFERKTLLDLASSIISGRLFDQAQRLAEKRDIAPILILEGTAKNLSESNMRWESIQGALVTISVFFGIPILRTRNFEETAKTFLYVVQQSRAFVSGGLLRSRYRPKGRQALRRYVLQSLPGVGPKRAEDLLNYFGSIESVINADMDDLTAIPGLGQQTAKKIRWTVSEPRGIYAS